MSWPGDPPPLTPPRARPQLLAARNASADALSTRSPDALPSRSPDAHHRMLQRAASLQSASNYHFSPRRKRVGAASPVSPRRMRRRLFFADETDSPAAPEGHERWRHAAGGTALAIIREAVEAGDAHVDLSDLNLDTVPDELAELKDLVVLTPSNKLVTDLQLTLGTNLLRRFPLAVCELTNLTTLLISHNRIAHLPPEIGNLVNLRELSVAHNRLRSLPLELTRLTRLHTLTVFPNPFMSPPPPSLPADSVPPDEAVLRRHLTPRAPLRPFALTLHNAGLPRLADLAARRLPRARLIALKHRLAQCVGAAPQPLALGRIVGSAVEPAAGTGVVAALAAQHLVLPAGHQCACCGRWFLMPAAELTVWAPLSLLPRPAPFVARLCCRGCLYSAQAAELLTEQ